MKNINNGEDEIRLNLGNSFSDSTDTGDTPADGWYHYSDEEYDEADYDAYDDTYYDDEYYEDDDYDNEYEEEEAPMKSSKKKKKSTKKKHRGLSIFAHVLLVICALLSAFYLSVLYAPIPTLTNLRNLYIQAGMSTLSHKWLVTAIVPGEIIDEVMLAQHESENEQIGKESNWGSISVEALPTFANDTITSEEAAAAQQAAEEAREEAMESATEATLDNGLNEGDSYDGPEYESADEATFFSMFHELDYDSMMDYLDEHPQVLDNGWSNIKINRSGLNDVGTSIETTNGHQVLALDAENGVLILRVYCGNSRGVMAILKDSTRLHNRPSGTLGIVGQTVGKITEANGGILGVNSGAFADDGYGNGGDLDGMAVCDGKIVGDRFYGNYKRIELRDDGKMYIVDSATLVYNDTLQACEFKPALIIDSKIVVDDNCGWTAPAPRTVLGQSERLEAMIVVIEGRFADSPGCSVVDIAELMREYDCAQALNLDGGTSSIMYYKGEYITRCSNTALPSGRPVPTALVYK